jgi:DNA-binding MarR family transcriptional regulator
VLVFGGPQSLRDLARAEQVRASTMSRIVDALEVQGLVQRRTSDSDRRAVEIRATKRGTALLMKGRERRVKFLASYLVRLNQEELADVAQAVHAIRGVLQ